MPRQAFRSVADSATNRSGHYVPCARCGRWVGPSDPGWLPDEEGGVECSLCVLGIDLGPGVIYPCRVEEDDDE